MDQQANSIKQLYPHLSYAELRLAEENLEQYLGLILRIYARLEQDPEAMQEFRVLTEVKVLPTITAKVDSH